MCKPKEKWEGDGCRKRPMSPNCCLQDKGDVGNPRLLIVKWCAKAITYLGSLRLKFVKLRAGYDHCKMPTFDINWTLCAGQKWSWKEKFTNIEWCANATADAVIQKKCLLHDATWRWLMSLAWSTLGLADPSFRWSTVMSPYVYTTDHEWCVHELADIFSRWPTSLD